MRFNRPQWPPLRKLIKDELSTTGILDDDATQITHRPLPSADDSAVAKLTYVRPNAIKRA